LFLLCSPSDPFQVKVEFCHCPVLERPQLLCNPGLSFIFFSHLDKDGGGIPLQQALVQKEPALLKNFLASSTPTAPSWWEAQATRPLLTLLGVHSVSKSAQQQTRFNGDRLWKRRCLWTPQQRAMNFPLYSRLEKKKKNLHQVVA
jgi:hypothetical protein